MLRRLIGRSRRRCAEADHLGSDSLAWLNWRSFLFTVFGAPLPPTTGAMLTFAAVLALLSRRRTTATFSSTTCLFRLGHGLVREFLAAGQVL